MLFVSYSYALFGMFDDLILLAKGGLVAYLGPVKKVEAYFEGLGITVPDRINPPDHYIDILEGIAKPDSDLNYKELPIRWMVHNGYPVPLDLQSELGLEGSSQRESVNGDTPLAAEGQSFAGDLWQDVKCKAEFKKDIIRHNFLKSNDLSKRVTPGVLQQYRYFLGRPSGGPLHATVFAPISILREREGSRDFDDELLGRSFSRRMNCWKRMNLLDEEEDLDLDGENVLVEKELEVPNEEGEW
ncbi:hypothetical protein Cgig2_027865 [Carnegiea gigantea]|uniref:ABC transporter family G domain-containing protein n=1 Tax=Carnegiea gigantea TaxID=171969 RepID=A0A9Q1GQ22_9CARY|nr:hypothetical protein Cgig2_027865 [Carnegiea gigantea]